jgi:hypothetical protein
VFASQKEYQNKPMTMTDSRSTRIAEVTPKAEDKGKDIVNDFLKYHTLDPNSVEDCFDGLSHAVLSLHKQRLQIKNSVG